MPAWRQLEDDRAELVAQQLDEVEISPDAGLRVPQLLHVGDETAALGGEDETGRRTVAPFHDGVPAREAIERRVDLYGAKPPGIMVEEVFGARARRIEPDRPSEGSASPRCRCGPRPAASRPTSAELDPASIDRIAAADVHETLKGRQAPWPPCLPARASEIALRHDLWGLQIELLLAGGVINGIVSQIRSGSLPSPVVAFVGRALPGRCQAERCLVPEPKKVGNGKAGTDQSLRQ